MGGGGTLGGGFVGHLHTSVTFHAGSREWSLPLEVLPAARRSAIGGNATYRGGKKQVRR